MFHNVVLEVFIGLVFIYFLYSLLATIIQEIFAQWFSLRSRLLIKAMRRMLEDDNVTGRSYWRNNSFVGFFESLLNLFTRFFYPIRKDENLIRAFYNHPTIKYLGESSLFSKPAYLHSHNFSQTMMQLLHGDEYDGRMQHESTIINKALENNRLNINPETLRHLRLLFADANQDSYLFKLKLEDWFDETMQRCSGWYKKQTQVIMMVTGFLLAWSFNVDTIAISKILVKDKDAREQIVQLAISRQKEYGTLLDTLSSTTIVKKETTKPGDTATSITKTTVKTAPSQSFLDSAYKKLNTDMLQVQGVLGFRGLATNGDSVECKKIIALYDSFIVHEPRAEIRKSLERIKYRSVASCCSASEKSTPFQQDGTLKVIGWLITALAVSLGASFWFDLLNKFIKLRGAGPVPNTTADSDRAKNSPANAAKDLNNIDIKG